MSKGMSLAENFLNYHSTAKIVVVVNTHYLENGFFIWLGDSPEEYKARSLGGKDCTTFSLSHVLIPSEILQDCTSQGVFYLSDAKDTSPQSQSNFFDK